MVTVATFVAVVTANTATVGFGLYSYSGLITLFALVMVVTEPKWDSACMFTLLAVVTGNVITVLMLASVGMVTLVSVIVVNVGLSVYIYSRNTGCSGVNGGNRGSVGFSVHGYTD